MMLLRAVFNNKNQIRLFIVLTCVAPCVAFSMKSDSIPTSAHPLSIIVPSDQLPIEVIVNGGCVPMHYSALGELCKWRFIGVPGLFPFKETGEGTCRDVHRDVHDVHGAISFRTIQKLITLTRGEVLILNKWRMLTFTSSKETGGFIMMLHHNESSATVFQFAVRPQRINVTYKEGSGNFDRVVVKVIWPHGCDEHLGDSSEEDCKEIIITEGKLHPTAFMSEHDMPARVVITEDTKLFVLKIHEDTRHRDSDSVRCLYDAIFYA